MIRSPRPSRPHAGAERPRRGATPSTIRRGDTDHAGVGPRRDRGVVDQPDGQRDDRSGEHEEGRDDPAATRRAPRRWPPLPHVSVPLSPRLAGTVGPSGKVKHHPRRRVDRGRCFVAQLVVGIDSPPSGLAISLTALAVQTPVHAGLRGPGGPAWRLDAQRLGQPFGEALEGQRTVAGLRPLVGCDDAHVGPEAVKEARALSGTE